MLFAPARTGMTELPAREEAVAAEGDASGKRSKKRRRLKKGADENEDPAAADNGAHGLAL